MLISDQHQDDLSAAIEWCDVCRGYKPGHCDDCHDKFLPSEPHYRSQTFHFHPATVGGVSGTRSVQKELCVECYRKDFAKAHPGLEVPDLPNRGVDPKFHAAQRTERNREIAQGLIGRLRLQGVEPATDVDLLARIAEVGLRFM